ncbi:chemotaxis protein CheW [Geobacter sp. OR-1]|uniref:chemotaxis protein CheW n=1 Tax=Geobacter sp. OR-1 TaxID=1266765 RepID=UPI000543D2C6|nr:chemotaxis protein CheW [Geobacter sp. OR-1]GAM11809.1 chemotaxis protein CheW [Geobacter sp. OR-1]
MASDIDRLVLFRLAGQRMAIDLATVTEVSELPETWPIPMAPGYFKGVMNSHGALTPVLDLSRYLQSGTGVAAGKIMVLDRSLADLALWVDDVERVIPSAEAGVVRAGDAPMAAVLEIHGHEVSLVSAAALLDKLDADLQGVTQVMFAGLEEIA